MKKKYRTPISQELCKPDGESWGIGKLCGCKEILLEAVPHVEALKTRE